MILPTTKPDGLHKIPASSKARALMVLLAGMVWLAPSGILAQEFSKRINVNVYGAIDYTVNRLGGRANNFFTLGEQDFFVTSRLSDRVSFLGETVVRFDSKTGTTFSASIERAQIKYDFSSTGNHSMLIGKMHSPVNYWNDVYHHGRLFFPTIDRPIAFSHFIPLHTMGVRLQGQNIGALNFGYDVMAGNGISSTDFSKTGGNLSLMASVHIKPFDGMRVQAGIYQDKIVNNLSGVHSGHSQNKSNFKGAVNFRLYTLSLSYFTNKFEFLNESVINVSRTDSLGRAVNLSSYLYMGLRLSDTSIPYIAMDFIDVSDDELHVQHLDKLFIGLGYRYEFNSQLSAKVQLMRLADIHLHDDQVPVPERDNYSFKVQFAYAL